MAITAYRPPRIKPEIANLSQVSGPYVRSIKITSIKRHTRYAATIAPKTMRITRPARKVDCWVILLINTLIQGDFSWFADWARAQSTNHSLKIYLPFLCCKNQV